MFVVSPQSFIRPGHGLDPERLYHCLKYKYNFFRDNPYYFKPSGTLIFCGSQGEGKTLSSVDYILNVLNRYPFCILVTNTSITGYPPNAYLSKVVKSDKDWLDDYKLIEPVRRHDFYSDIDLKLREHYKYAHSDLSVDDYVSKFIILEKFNRRTDFDDWKSSCEWELLSLIDNSLITSDSILSGLHSHVCLSYLGLDTLKYVNNGKFGVLFFIDEIHLELNSLDSKNIDVSIMVEISQQRKQRKHIVGTSQRYMRMAKPLREQIKDVIVCKCFFGCIQYNKFIDGDSSAEKDGKLQFDTRHRYLWFHSPYQYLKYDTYAKMRRYNNEWQGRARDPYFDLEVLTNGSS